jgi:hypothetical protein
LEVELSTGLFSLEFFNRWIAASAKDPELSVIGRYLTLRLGIVCRPTIYCIELQAGTIVEARPIGSAEDLDVVLSGSETDWARFMVEEPRSGYNDIIGMDRVLDSFSIEGDRTLFIRHLRGLSRLLRIAQLCADLIPDDEEHVGVSEEAGSG